MRFSWKRKVNGGVCKKRNWSREIDVENGTGVGPVVIFFFSFIPFYFYLLFCE